MLISYSIRIICVNSSPRQDCYHCRMITRNILLALFSCFLFLISCPSHASTDTLRFHVSVDYPTQSFRVEIEVPEKYDSISLVYPSWTPGYYQLMHYADNIESLTALDVNATAVPVVKKKRDTWIIASAGKTVRINYRVKATRNFVATSFVGTDHAYIMPASLFPIMNNDLSKPSRITFENIRVEKIATSLQQAGKNAFISSSHDELYDSPILIGPLEELPAFEVQGRKHLFTGIHLGSFDRSSFVNDLQKIVVTASQIFNDIPYEHYTFLAIGPGQGGIEHLASTSFAFEGESLNDAGGKIGMYSFLAHEYFHHYNAKRIRPIELGPFDYSKENRTRQLWIAEGVTAYYDHLIIARAGLCEDEKLLGMLSDVITGFESRTGKNFQTLADASYNTWNDGPFGGDRSKTVSVYEKGVIVALLLDMTIRKNTDGKKSLDDVMRALYTNYYKARNRGFTEDEFRQTCESISGTSLEDVFDYVYTLKPMDYENLFKGTGMTLKKTIGENNKTTYTLSADKTSGKGNVILKHWAD
jgi:predicted metalloprotease with PDZ domain